MASHSNVDRMQIMHHMCKREVEQLKANLNKYLDECEVMMRNDIFKHFRKDSGQATHANVFALMAYDKYMSRVAAVTNLARKFNIHLQLHNVNKILTGGVGCGIDLEPVPYLLEEFVEWHKVLSDKDGCLDYDIDSKHYRSVEGEKWTSYRSVEKDSISSIALLNDNEKVPDINAVDDKTATVRKIKFAEPESVTLESLPSCVHLRDLTAFVAGYHFTAFVTYIHNIEELCFYACQMRNDMLYDLTNMYNLPKCVRIPSTNVIFGISINSKNILRGVLLQSPDKKNENNLRVLLIDYGELVPLNINDVQFYDLPKVYKDLPAQAMKCILLGIKDATSESKETNAFVLTKTLRTFEFKEVNFEVVRQIGRVLHVYMVQGQSKGEKSPDVKLNFSKNPFVNSFDENSFSDDLQTPKETILLKSRLDEVLENGILNLEVMHISRPDSFYAQILNEKDEQLEQLFWNSDELSVEQELTEAPKLGDLILAQYAKDCFWYRAKVIGVEGDTKFQVFYVDYGNTETVPLKGIAKCNNVQEKEPFRAVLCRIADISDITNGDEARFEKVIQMLVVMLLNQRIEVQVIEKINAKELRVHVLDQEFTKITQMLYDLEYTKKIEV